MTPRTSAISRRGACAAGALRAWSGVYLLFVAGFSVWSCYAVIDGRYSVAHADDWRILDDFFSIPLFEWLFAGQNGHRIPLTFALFAIDYALLDGNQLLLVLATLATAGGAVAILYRAFRASGDVSDSVSRISFGFAWFCIFWAGSAYYFLWGVSHGNLMAVFWLFVCMLCLVENEARRGDALSHGSTYLLTVVGLAAVFATYSFGAGFSVWLSVLAVVVVRRYPWQAVAALGLAAALTLASFSSGLSRSTSVSFGASLSSLWIRPVDAAEYAAALVGSAVGSTARGLRWIDQRSVAAISRVVGVIGIAALAAHGVRIFWRPHRANRRELLAFGLMACAASSAGLIAFGRLWLGGASQIHPRFLLWSVLFWVGAVLAIPSAVRGGAREGRGRVLLAALLPAISLCMLPAMRDSRSMELARIRSVAHLSLALLLEIPSEGIASKIFQPKSDQAELVQRVAKRLRRDRRNLFSDVRADLSGSPLSDRFTLLPADRCGGTRMTMLSVPTEGKPARQVRGLAWHEDAREPLAHVVITDAKGVIRGLANLRPEIRGPPAPRARRVHPLQAMYSGYIAGFDPQERYNAWGVLEDSSACWLRPASAPPGR